MKTVKSYQHRKPRHIINLMLDVITNFLHDHTAFKTVISIYVYKPDFFTF